MSYSIPTWSWAVLFLFLTGARRWHASFLLSLFYERISDSRVPEVRFLGEGRFLEPARIRLFRRGKVSSAGTGAVERRDCAASRKTMEA